MNLSNQYPSLKEKVVFISGGATGIGANLVEAFYLQGAKVVFVDILQEQANTLVKTLIEKNAVNNKAHVAPVFFHCDLREVTKIKQVFEKVKSTLGPVSVLLNNAASDTRHKFTEVTEEYWNERININLRPSFFTIQAAHSHMKDLGGGSIVNFGSMSWYECQDSMTGYTTSKAGLEGMTRGLARELGRDNIRINTLVPGWVMTERQMQDWVDENTEKEIQQSQCLKNKLMPEDISAMALFLASDDSKMCSAQNFIVDGGWI